MLNKGIQEVFGTVPKTYELVNHVLTFGMDICWRKKAVRAATVAGGNLWLDICSGTGETASYLKKAAPEGTTVISADFCEPMLREAVKKPEGGDIGFTLADANVLPFADNTFDLITISFATRNLNISRKALIQCFTEFHRVLKEGGHFINLETSQPSSKFLRRFFHAYIGLFVRPIGEAMSGSKSGYKYLSHTIPRFYDADEFSSIIREAGFDKVAYNKLLLGIAAIHHGIK
jgi:demethylmenaquinone methyltransferase/2-methoxy-6-polyprenyl-1,4-benzoquinol methylase